VINEARIIRRWNEVAFGRHEVLSQWEGPTHLPVFISGMEGMDVIEADGTGRGRFKHRLTHYPWPLRLVEERPLQRGALYVRVDGANVFAWLYYWLRARAFRPYQWFKVRLILTAMVWGIGWVKEGEIAEWVCLKRKRTNR